MTHKERLLELLKDCGVTPREEDEYYKGEPSDTVTLEAGEGAVEGYPGFVCAFSFAKDGSFQGVGVWE